MMDRVNSALRRVPAWLLYIVGALWGAWLFYLALSGQMGPEPINALEREYGGVGIKLLVAVLLVTPLRRWTGLNLLKFRRAIGVLTFFYIVAHFMVWALLDIGSFGRVWADIVKRPYITVGMSALLLMTPLAITSNNWSVRRLRAGWGKLHMLTYPIALLAGIHYLWLVKGFQIEPLIYLAIFIGLIATRHKKLRALISQKRR